jgi:hypothetical protein
MQWRRAVGLPETVCVLGLAALLNDAASLLAAQTLRPSRVP